MRRGWELTLSGWVQADLIPYSQDSVDELDPATGAPLNETRFLIRRGRLRTEATKGSVWGAFEVDGNTIDGPEARILAAQAGWRFTPEATKPPLVAVTMGLFRIPFGFDVPAGERDKPFLEQPAVLRALFPGNYDAGVMVSGAYGVARYSLAMMNGAPVADAQWRGLDPVSSYEFVGRLGAIVHGPARSWFDVGVSALAGTGLSPGSPPTKDDVQWIDENQDGIVQITELQIVPGETGRPSQTFSRDAIGADAQVHWCLCVLGNGMAFGEVVLATNLDRGLVYSDPIQQSRDVRHLGFMIGVVQDVGRYAQVGVRYDRYDADRDAFEQAGIDLVGVDKIFSTLSVMATARWTTSRLLVQYDRERNPFGRDDTGQPATRSADRLTLRAQVGW